MDKLKEKCRLFPLIFQRWIDLVFLNIISAFIFVLLYPATTKLTSKLAEWLPQSAIYFNLSIPHLMLLFLLTTFLWFIIIRLGGFRYRMQFRKNILLFIRPICLYPPTWLFAFVGAVLYYWITTMVFKDVRFDWPVIGLAIISFIPGIIFASILDTVFSLRKPLLSQPVHNHATEKPIKSFRALLQNPSDFIKWLNKETPIQSQEDDLFDLAIFARRIAKMLQATPLKTIAVVGSYGSGKSSIMNMIEDYLKITERLDGNINSIRDNNHIDTADIIHCNIQGWGLKKNAAVEHILQSILLKLSRSVDCLGLTSIPADYSIALSNSGSAWLKPLAVLSKTTIEPLEILRKLDTALTCTGKRMIIVMEDIDRNTTSMATWKELTSLLDRLKDLHNISFVLAINKPSMKYDILLRVCEHIEFIPTLPQAEILECIKFFRNDCLTKFSHIDIDCRTREERDKHIGLKDTSQEYNIATMLGVEVNDPITVITKLLNNPRTLKSTLRHTLHSWNSLHGEIDFDDLFAARVIYNVAPEAYAFMNENISIMRHFDSKSTSERTRTKQKENREKLDTMFQNINGSWDSGLVKILIDFLFPGWIENNFYQGHVPQGVVHSSPTDYWIRLNREELAADEISDQEILHALLDWKSDHNKCVYRGLSLSEAVFQIDGLASVFEHFAYSLNGSELRTLAGELFLLIRKDGGKIPKDTHYHGFIELWRLSLDRPVDYHNEWILGEIKKAIPISLRFANELYYYWRNQDHPSISTKAQTPMLRNDFIKAAKQVYQSNKQAFINALDPAYIYDVYHFMIYYSERDGGGPGFNPDEWKWLTDVLIEAGEANPQTVVPQLVPIVSNESSNFEKGLSYSLNKDRIDSLFGNVKSTVLKLLATKIDTSIFDKREKDRIEYVRQEAAGRILEQRSFSL